MNSITPGASPPPRPLSDAPPILSVHHDLERFCKEQCPTVRSAQMHDFINKGNDLIKALEAQSSSGNPMDPKLVKPDSAVHLMWALTSKAAEKGQLFTNGSMRIQTEPLFTAKELETFLKACGEQDKSSYPRISTHMKEGMEKGTTQWGIDLRSKEVPLPIDKRTLLFAPQPDGTMFLKMEKSGCPPFWKKGYDSWDNFKEFVSHSTDFISTRFEHKAKNHYAKKKEHFPPNLQKEYSKVVDSIFKKSFFEKVLSFVGVDTNKAEIEKFNELSKGGIDSVLKGVNDLKKVVVSKKLTSAEFEALESVKESNSENSPRAKQLLEKNTKLIEANRHLEDFREKLEETRSKAISQTPDYTGNVKGEEVILTLKPS